LATGVQGIFSGGDAVTGTSFIVDAIAAGHRAASSIGAYLRGEALQGLKSNGKSKPVARLEPQVVRERLNSKPEYTVPRHETAKRPAQERKLDYAEIYAGLSEAEARAEASRCLRCGVCSECNQCVYVCRAGAILHDEVEHLVDLNVGAVVLAPGVETMPGDIRPEYGYGRYPNVVTSLQFERMLSASGPFGGVVQRPSDGKHPEKVAWIQCVGSRDYTTAPDGSQRGAYCSSVCCMYATKEAIIAKEHDPHIQPTIFYMDLRSFGKGFEGYIDRARGEHGIRYLRCMVSSVKSPHHAAAPGM
jgi:ferredoxin